MQATFFSFFRLSTMLRNLLLVALYFSSLFLSAQSPADWWYFGTNAGMHFTSSGPVSVSGGALSTSEGCASISDNQGNLLFYTDGTFAYDVNNTQMPNGFGMLGNPSSTHSAIIVPRPNFPNEYYIFTVVAGAAIDGMNYSKVNMTLNSGLGDIDTAEKNVPLVASTSEKVTAIKKSNGYWVITHVAETDEFQAFEVTSAGVNSTPVISNTGWPTSGFGFGIKASSGGNKIAAVYYATDSIHVYNFNVQTGEVTNDLKIGTSMGAYNCYGLEFSPSGQFLYLQNYAQADVRQFDLSQGTSAAISASEVVVGGSGSGGGQLQLGPDNKMYCARQGQTHLSRINDPDLLGSLCNWEDTAVVLTSGSSSFWGLPTFIQSFFNVDANAEGFCLSDTTLFSTDTAGVDSAFWNFGDPASGALNTSDLYFPGHIFTDTGSYTITLIAFSDTLIDTVIQTIYIYPRQQVNLGPDLLLCDGDTALFDAKQLFSTYLWQDSTTNDSMIVTQDSTIWVTVIGICDTVSDTVEVRFDFPVNFEFGPDTTLCDGNSIVLDADIQVRVDTFFWNTADTLDSILVTETGFYRLEASNACGIVVDSITVTFIPVPGSTLLPPDTLNCFDNEIVLTHPGLDNVTYVWSDSTTKKTYTVDTTETVWLAWYNECGFAIDTFTAIFNGEIKVDIGDDTTICEGDSIRLTATWPGSTYVWNTGDTTDTLWTLQEDKLYVVTITYNLCSTIESRRVDQDLLFCPTINCALRYANVITPNGDGLNDRFRAESDCEIYRYEMRIYNRWGQQVHHSTNISYGWDGYIDGAPAADGVYYFMIDFKDNVVIDEDQNVYKGNFELIRE